MAQKKKDSKMMGKIIKTAVSGVLCVALAGGIVAANVLIPPNASSVQSILGLKSGGIDNSKAKTEGINMEYSKPGFDTEDALVEDEIALNKKIAAEGIILLKNDAGKMPYSTDTTFSFVSHSAVSYIGGNKVDMKTAFEDAGFGVNEALWKFYSEGNGKDYGLGVGSVSYGDDEDFSINECPLSVMKAEPGLTDSMKNTVPVFVFSRVAGEGRDMPRSMYNHTDVEEDKTKTYLEPDSVELEILQYLNDNFDDVVLLLNSSAAVDLSWVEDYPSIHTVISAPAMGDYGLCSLAEIFSGKVNPSGRTVDTYEVDAMNSPAAQNFGDFAYYDENGNLTKYNYVSYKEGIYVGYRYYETRYEDKVLGQGNAGDYNYDDAVMYPFGYGLSYTTFDWSDYNTSWDGDTCTVTVKVTNTGSVAGKDVVEVYAQSPYTDYDKTNKVEKAAVELVGYAKTSELAPGASETVTVTFDQEQLKSYDYTNAKTYILDAGDYYITAAKNAHDAVNNILAVKGKTVEDGMTADGNTEFVATYTPANGTVDTTTYKNDTTTGVEVTNQLDQANGGFQYLSRSDWTGTWPTTYQNGSWEAPETVLTALEITRPEDESAEMPTFDEAGNLKLCDLIGADYDDARWETLLSQMSKKDTYNLIRHAGYGTMAVESIGAPGTVHKDGPAGISSTLAGGNLHCMAYEPAVVLASTYNVELASRRGKLVGEDSLSSGVQVWYAPAMNIHRAANSGRNFEYYAEDPLLSGVFGAAETAGFQSKGGIVTIKHFAFNDQETNRIGGAMFVNEQAARQLYLKPFEMSVVDGGAVGIMSGMNRIGCRWIGGHEGIMTNILRGEWGYKGFVITDQTSFNSFDYCDIREGLAAGNDLWLNTAYDMWALNDSELTATVMQNARTAAHRYLYAVANSNAMNGVDVDTTVKNIIPAWQYAYMVLVVFVAVMWFFGFKAVRALWASKRYLAKKAERKAKRAAKKAAKANKA